MNDMLQFLILAGITAMITIGCGGHYAFSYQRRGHLYALLGLLVIVGYFASIIIVRFDNTLSNQYDWDNEGKLFVLGAMAAGIVFGIALNAIIVYLIEEHQRRSLHQQMPSPFPTPASKIDVKAQDPRISRSDQRRELGILV